MPNDKTLFIFAGPNGSGKSTLVRAVLSMFALQYVCADDIDKHLQHEIADEKERAAKAMETAERAVYALIDKGAFCGYETVLSSDYKWPIFQHAHARGMRIIAFFIATKDVEINCKRVAKRVAEGGHAVPDEKVRSRYGRSIERLPKLMQIADVGFVFDNSLDCVKPVPLLMKIGRRIRYDARLTKEYAWAADCLSQFQTGKQYKTIQEEDLSKALGADWLRLIP